MAAAAAGEEECETRLCSNCKKDIPAANFTIHEIHCRRNIGVCPICMEPFPKLEMRNHQELEHTQVTCKCSMKMDSGLLQEHRASACPLRPTACQHCEIELAFNKLQEHEDYCGARTERCSRCSRNVMLRDLQGHPEDCAKQAQEARISQAKPGLNSEVVFRNIQTIRNILRPDDAAGSLSRMSNFPESRLYNCLSGDQLSREFGRRTGAVPQPDRNRAHLEKIAAPLPFGGEPDCNFDYLLALSLQHENSSREPSGTEVQRDFWKNIFPARTGPAENSAEANDSSIFSRDLLIPANTTDRSKTEILLPCEFCEELYPEGDLILHQTGCNPRSALASFSKRSTFVPRSERLRDLWEQLQSERSAGSGRETLPLQPELPCGSLMLPCEFCGVQLEEEVLFHHQDQCDLRPATTPSTGRTPSQPGAPAVESSEGTESPDRPRRRIRHQGEISPQYLEEFSKQKPPQLVQGSHPRGNQVAARRIQLTSPNNIRENHAGPPRAGKAKDLGGGRGRAPHWGPADPAAASLPPRRSSLRFPVSYEPSFGVAIPTRPSLRSDGRRSPTGTAQYNSSKAKPWRAEPDYPDNE
ncbi:TRAF-type zinc finger domain-containing protein 1 [Elgaria multicarinata webbii]|uniref:TRAF-type zinc finger domain-containing protein 1 n=1 Tax=Elgaria multicarinata webbii TaxID=159646 RepID=UPI002FCD425F